MDNSVNNADTAPERGGFLRAMFSAGVFGTLGAWVGSVLGKRANAPGSDVARSVMKWSMGAFSGLLAAYCSFKAGEQESSMQESQPGATATPDTAMKKFTTGVDASTVEHHGKAAENQARARG